LHYPTTPPRLQAAPASGLHNNYYRADNHYCGPYHHDNGSHDHDGCAEL
jgi:hypothetical protein